MTASDAPVLIAAGNPGAMTGPGNNTWLIDGAEPTLVDAGVGTTSHVSAILRYLGPRALRRVLVTHGHPDHASGVPALVAAWPSLEAWKITEPGETGWCALADGQTIVAGNRHLVVVGTPGHAVDHACFWDPARRDLYAGDMVVAGASVMIPGNRGGGLRAYLRSLERLAALDPGRIYPGHGPVIDRPREIIDGHLKHRALRERQIMQCLDQGMTDVEAIVRRLYPGLAEGLDQAARLTVAAHLDKLREDGRLD